MEIPTDALVPRNRVVRAITAVLSVGVTLGALTLAGRMLGEAVGAPYLLMIMGLAIGFYLAGRIVIRTIVSNPANIGLVTQNPFSTERSHVPYGPGFHFSFPWEARTSTGNIPLGLITETIEEKLPSRSGEISIQVTVQLMVHPPHMVRFFVAGVPSVQIGLRETIRAWLARELPQLPANDIVGEVDKISAMLERFLRVEQRDALLESYGITVISSRIGSVELAKKMQLARDTEDQAFSIIRSMATVLGFSSTQSMFDAVSSGRLNAQDMRAVREDVLAMAGVLRPRVSRLDLSGIDPKNSTAAAAIFAALNENG